jgi:phosphonate transport system substrate-binding protein
VARPWSSSPEPLVFIKIPTEGAEELDAHWTHLTDYLTEQLGRPVEFLVVTDYAAATEALKYGHADIVNYGPSSYILAEEEVDIIPLVSPANEDGTPNSYQSYIIARADSDYADANELEGATFAYVDIGSTSGYLIPATYFKKSGIELGEIFFAGSHPAAIEAVKNGSVDAGCCASNRWESALKEGVIKPGELVILYESEPILRGPIVVRADMPVELREALTDALINTPPEIVEQLGIERRHFGPAPAGAYDVMREIQQYLGLTG